MSPYRTENRTILDAVRRNKTVELGPAPDGLTNRVRRAALIGTLPDRIDAGVVEDFGAEHLLYAGSKPPVPHFALRTAAGLGFIALLSLFF